MKELKIKLDDTLFEGLYSAAAKKGTEIQEVVEGLIKAWVESGSVVQQEDDWTRMQPFLKLRVQGIEYPEISAKLSIREEEMKKWDEEVRHNKATWRKAFFYLKKSTNPLNWELKTMDAFYTLWGRYPV